MLTKNADGSDRSSKNNPSDRKKPNITGRSGNLPLLVVCY